MILSTRKRQRVLSTKMEEVRGERVISDGGEAVEDKQEVEAEEEEDLKKKRTKFDKRNSCNTN